MSAYNNIRGINPSAFFVLPLLNELGIEGYPNFRDSFIDKDKKIIKILIKNHKNIPIDFTNNKNFLHKQDFWEFKPGEKDFSFSIYIFKIPVEWQKDFNYLIKGDFNNLSHEYKSRICSVYPKLFNKI